MTEMTEEGMITEGMTGLVEMTGEEMMGTEEMIGGEMTIEEMTITGEEIGGMGTEEMTIEEIIALLLPSTGIGEMDPAEMTREGEIQERRQTEMTTIDEIQERRQTEMTMTGGGILHQGTRGGETLHQGTRGRTEMWTKWSLPNPGHRLL